MTNDWKYAIISPYKSKGGHIEALKSTINRKLYSIKRLFFFEFNQDSILQDFYPPHFDYCSSLLLYFTKTVIKRIENFYNICLFRLTGICLFNLTYLQQYQILRPLKILVEIGVSIEAATLRTLVGISMLPEDDDLSKTLILLKT